MYFIFDFDYTLYDTGRFKKELRTLLLEEFGITEELFQKDYRSCFDKGNMCYDLKKHLMLMGVDSENEKLTYFFHEQEHYIFEGVRELLERIKSKDQYLVLLTRGHYETQMLKLESVSSLTQFFDEIVIVQNPKYEWFEHQRPLDEHVVFVNDKEKENNEVQKKIPSADIFLMSGPYSQKSEQKLFTIESLTQKFRENGWV